MEENIMIILAVIYGILYACMIGAIVFNIRTANRNIEQMRKNLQEYLRISEDSTDKVKIIFSDDTVTFINKEGNK